MLDRRNVVAEMNCSGTNVRILEYQWDVGDCISESRDDFILCYRAFPAQLTMAAKLNEGSHRHFGQLMLCPPDVRFSTTATQSPARSRHITCRFSADLFSRVSSLDWDAVDLNRCLDIQNPRIESAMQRLGLEAVAPGFASSMLIEAVATTIAVEIARHFQQENSDLRVRTRDGLLAQADLVKIYEFVEATQEHCPSGEEIAKLCQISLAHLRRSFKRTTGQTVHEYVEKVRLRRAKMLLSDTDTPIKVISHRLGFADTSTFSATFRRVAGETPGGFRRRARC